MSRRDPLLPNALIVARREYGERVGSRLFHLSTVLLAILAVLVAFSPLFVRMVDRATITRVAVVSTDVALADRSISILGGILNGDSGGGSEGHYSLERWADANAALAGVADGKLQAVLVAERGPTGRLSFSFHAGDAIGDDRLQQLSVGAFGVAVLDFSANNPVSGFQMPDLEVLRGGGAGEGGQPIASAEYASRRILGIVFVVLIFITLVIYGMWVAAGVVAEKASRVMELMISAASARQLVVGKVIGIGTAGLTQAAFILLPAVATLAVEDTIAVALLGPGPSVAPSLAGLTPALLAAYLAFFILGFSLYALIYAAAGSLVSRAEDLQMLALPLSLVAIAGYLQAVMALTGGTSGLIRFASYVPFWSPFVMLTRLTVGRVEPWELVLSLGLLVLTIGLTLVVAIRVYAAGVLLYGQRPSLAMLVTAVRGT
jgi:ABC-2 type transport system permease protein